MTVLNIFFGEHRRVLFALITAALKEKVAGSALGKLWIVLFPITFLAIYGTVFYVILGIRVPELGGEQSLLLIFCGIVPFFAFAESLNVGTLSLISNRETISSSIIPFELLVLRDVIVANVNLIVGMLIIVVSAAFVGNLTWAALWIPASWFSGLIHTGDRLDTFSSGFICPRSNSNDANDYYCFDACFSNRVYRENDT